MPVIDETANGQPDNGQASVSTAPTGGGENNPAPGEWDGDRHGLVGRLYRYLAGYVVVPEPALLAVAAWVMASWLDDLWDRFPLLGVTSPEKRCGKTRLLE